MAHLSPQHRAPAAASSENEAASVEAPAARGVIRVLIADDHAMFREALRTLLGNDPQLCVIGEAADGRAAVRLVRELEPDLLLLDLRMPSTSGLEVLKEMSRVAPAIRVLVLTGDLGEGEIFEALRLGARGVVLKNSATSLLFKAIRTVMAGQYWVGRGVVAELVERMRGTSPEPADGGARSAAFGLTSRELEMVGAVAAGGSNSDIAAQFGISAKTVKHHLTNIFEKLGVSNRLELAVFALENRVDSVRFH